MNKTPESLIQLFSMIDSRTMSNSLRSWLKNAGSARRASPSPSPPFFRQRVIVDHGATDNKHTYAEKLIQPLVRGRFLKGNIPLRELSPIKSILYTVAGENI